jgi:hypothetical protein
VDVVSDEFPRVIIPRQHPKPVSIQEVGDESLRTELIVPRRQEVMARDDDRSGTLDNFTHPLNRESLGTLDVHLNQVDPADPVAIAELIK